MAESMPTKDISGVATFILSFRFSGTLSTGFIPERKLMPFPYQIVGAWLSLHTAPTGSSVIFDILAGANATAEGSLTSLWPTNNGSSGKPDHRPTVAISGLDQGSMSVPDGNVPATTFSGSSPTNDPQTSTLPQGGVLAAPGTVAAYVGKAGDVIEARCIQIGSGTAGSDACLTLWGMRI